MPPVVSTRARLIVGSSLVALVTALPMTAHPTRVDEIVVDASSSGILRTFSPQSTLGATLDGQSAGDVDRIYRRSTIARMLEAGFEPISYRLRTELACEAWHWNPSGRWSDTKRRQGYWTSSSRLGASIRISRGYRLPRRGNTIDQADDDGYSRIDDGDPSTYWKSNPYVTSRYTHDSDEAHPQHVVIDLGAKRGVDAVRIDWALPYAVRFDVEYWQGEDAVDDPAEGHWIRFDGGEEDRGAGGSGVRRLSAAPITAQFVRVVMTASGGGALVGSRDPRDAVGYAIREIGVGRIGDDGSFVDEVRHAADRRAQTVIYVSSTDPWHRATDLDPNLEQPGLDLFFRCGVTRGLPAMLPVGVLTGSTPEDGAAQIRYVLRRGYPLGQVELGEEPDGQYVQPEDFAALYLQWASAIRDASPARAFRIGGPAFQSTQDTIGAWPDASGDCRWLARFLRYVRARDRMADFEFLSFEWYPFDDLCESVEQQLVEAPRILATVLANWKREGLPDDLPVVATEYGYSSYAGSVEVDIPGALENADFIGRFLERAGSSAYFYGLEPGALGSEPDCPSFGGLMLFLQSSRGRRLVPVAAFWAARMVCRDWTAPGDGVHELHRTTLNAGGAATTVSAYTVRRPDGTWSVMLINVSPRVEATVRVIFESDERRSAFDGDVDVVQFSPKEYVWHPQERAGYADPNLPPARSRAPGREPIVLPPYSMTVVSGRVSLPGE